MIKLLYCIPSLENSGGTERMLINKVNYLSKLNKYKIYIVLTETQTKEPYFKLDDSVEIINTDINFEDDYRYNTIKRIFVFKKKIRLYQQKLSNILYSIKPDYTTTLLSHEIDFIGDIKDGSFKIGECHFSRNFRLNFVKSNTKNPIIIGIAYIRNFILKYKVKKLDTLVCLTKEDYNAWTSIKNKIVIPNFISFKSDKKSALKNKKLIGVGRYSKEKGFDLLLQVWKNIYKQYPDWKLFIYGDGNERRNLENYVYMNNVKNVFLEHSVSNIVSKYTESSIFIMPSRFEGFGLALVEAMECGLPVVAFDCGYGPCDIIKNDIDGFLIPQGNLELMQKKIEDLMNSFELRSEISNNAIIKAEQYSIENIIKQWIDLYK